MAKHLSFSKAAGELCITHSAVSQSIKALEHHLEVKLFNRSNAKSISLTRTGTRYLSRITEAFDIIIRANADIIDEGSHHRLVVNVPSSFMTVYVTPNIQHYQQLYQNTQLKFSSNRKSVEFDHQNFDCEIIYASAQNLQQDCVCKKLLDDKLILIYPKFTDDISLDELLKFKKAIYVNDVVRESDWPLYCEKLMITEPAENQRIYVPTTLQALEMVRSGYGVFVTHSALLLKNELTNIELHNKTVPCEKGYYFCAPPEKFKLSKVANFYQWINTLIVE